MRTRLARRELVGLLAATAAWPAGIWAQEKRIWSIGILTPANPEPFRTILQRALHDLGYVIGENTTIAFRSADGEPGRLSELATELVRLNVDLIVTQQTPAAQAAQRATRSIPIVMAGAGDPLAVGLVSSLARPEGNITGLSATTAEIGGKLLEALHEILPALRRVAVLANAADPFTRTFVAHLQQPARVMKVELQVLPVQEPAEFAAAFAAMAASGAEAVIVQPSLPRKAAIDLAMRQKLPAVSPLPLFPREGGLMSYAANSADIWRRAAQYVDRILKGGRPDELPVEQPVKFDLIVNLKTAKALGLTIPETFLARADEVIE